MGVAGVQDCTPQLPDNDPGLSEPLPELVFAQVLPCDSQQLQATLQLVTASTSLDRFGH